VSGRAIVLKRQSRARSLRFYLADTRAIRDNARVRVETTRRVLPRKDAIQVRVIYSQLD